MIEKDRTRANHAHASCIMIMAWHHQPPRHQHVANGGGGNGGKPEGWLVIEKVGSVYEP